jgi:hypothetical protein
VKAVSESVKWAPDCVPHASPLLFAFLYILASLGAGLTRMDPELAVLASWLMICFALAIKLFRWRSLAFRLPSQSPDQAYSPIRLAEPFTCCASCSE